MNITINGTPREVREAVTAAALLEELGFDAGMVVVERNRRILERAELEAVRIHEGDVLEIVRFVGGG